MKDPKEIIERGYDAMSARFDAWRQGIEGSPELEWAEDLLTRLPEDPDLLELGSGGARGPTGMLAKAGRLTGVDISLEQVRAAARHCPEARFLHADFTEVELEPESFDAVVSVYVFNHVSREELQPLVERIGGWLRSDGYFLGTFGVSGTLGVVESDWLGVPMFFASFTEDENLGLVRDAGLEIARTEVVTIREPEGEGRFQWLLARKPPVAPGASG